MDRSLDVIYCDDIRMEMQNKVSYIGVYRSGMEVMSAGPDAGATVLPKLCIFMTARTPKERPFKKLSFKLLKDSEVIQEVEVPSDALSQMSNVEDTNTDTTFLVLGAMIVVQPFAIDRSFILRSRAYADEDEELIAGGLKINLLNGAQSPQTESSQDAPYSLPKPAERPKN